MSTITLPSGVIYERTGPDLPAVISVDTTQGYHFEVIIQRPWVGTFWKWVATATSDQNFSDGLVAGYFSSADGNLSEDDAMDYFAEDCQQYANRLRTIRGF